MEQNTIDRHIYMQIDIYIYIDIDGYTDVEIQRYVYTHSSIHANSINFQQRS